MIDDLDYPRARARMEQEVWGGASPTRLVPPAPRGRASPTRLAPPTHGELLATHLATAAIHMPLLRIQVWPV